MGIFVVLSGVAVASLWAGFAWGRATARKTPTVTLEDALRYMPWLYAVVFAFVVSLAGFFLLGQRSDLLWHTPFYFQLYFQEITWSLISGSLALVFGAALAVARHTQHVERHKLAVAVVGVLLAVQVASYRYSMPIADELTEMKTTDGVVLQTSGESCAAASGANVAALLDVVATEREMAEVMNTTFAGTSMPQIVVGMEAFGITCEPLDVRTLASVTPPAFLFIDHPEAGPESHAVTYVGTLAVDGELRHEIWDPMGGKEQWSASQASDRWHGRAVSCRR